MGNKISLTIDANLALGNLKSQAQQLKSMLQDAAKVNFAEGSTDGFEKRLKKLQGEIENFSAKSKDGFSSMSDVNAAGRILDKIRTEYASLSDQFEGFQLNPKQLLPKEVFDRLKELRSAVDQTKSNIKDYSKEAIEKDITHQIEASQDKYEKYRSKKDRAQTKRQELQKQLLSEEEVTNRQSQISGLKSAQQEKEEQLRQARNNAEQKRQAAENRKEALARLNDQKNQLESEKKIREEQLKSIDNYDDKQLKEFGFKKAPVPRKSDAVKNILDSYHIKTASDLKKQYEDRIFGKDQSPFEKGEKGKYEKAIQILKNYEQEVNNANKQTEESRKVAREAAKAPIQTELSDITQKIAQNNKMTQELGSEKSAASAVSMADREVTKLKGEVAQIQSDIKKAEDDLNQKTSKENVQAVNNQILEQNKIISSSDEGMTQETAKIEQLRTALGNIADPSQQASAQIEILKNKFKELGVEEAAISNFTDIDQFATYLKNLDDSHLKTVLDTLKMMDPVLKEAKKDIDNLGQGFQNSSNQMREYADREREIDSLKSRLTYFLGINNALNITRRTIRQAFNSVKQLDKAMTQTAVVTKFSIGDMWDQLPRYTQAANELGATTQGAYETMTLFYQQGLDTNQTFALGTETMKMARIAGLDYANATNLMTAALRGFNMQLNETSAQRVNDVYSKLAAITAADTQEIATAMTKTASIANSANMNFETTAALLAQIIETTRESPETAGTAMKTIIARFSEVKKLYSEGQLTGTDEEGEAIAINKIDAALQKVGISLKDFILGNKGLDEIFMELASKWDSLDMATQRYIATMAAGSRQQSRFVAMMSNYGRTLELVDAAENSQGASQEQFDKTLESLDSKLNQLSNAWQEFTMGLANEGIIKTAVDGLTGLVTILNKITDSLGNGGAGAAAKVLLFAGALKTLGTISRVAFAAYKNKTSFNTELQNMRNVRLEHFKQVQGQQLPNGATITSGPNWRGQYTWQSQNGTLVRTKLPGAEANQAAAGFAVLAGAVGAFSKVAKDSGAEELGNALQHTSTAALAAAATFKVLSMAGVTIGGWAVAGAAALVGLVGVISYAMQQAEKNTLEYKIAQLEKAATAAEKAATNAKESFENLLSMGDKYSNTQNALKKLVKGTDEYRKAILDANDAVLQLVQNHPELQGAVQTSEDGVLTIEKEKYDQYLDSYSKYIKDSQASALFAKGSENQIKAFEAGQTEEKARDYIMEKAWTIYNGHELVNKIGRDYSLDNLENVLAEIKNLEYNSIPTSQRSLTKEQFENHQKEQIDVLDTAISQFRTNQNNSEKYKFNADNYFKQSAEIIAKETAYSEDVQKVLTKRISQSLSNEQALQKKKEDLEKEIDYNTETAVERFKALNGGIEPDSSYKKENGNDWDINKLIDGIARKEILINQKQDASKEAEEIDKTLAEFGGRRGVVASIISESYANNLEEAIKVLQTGFDPEEISKIFGLDGNIYRARINSREKVQEAAEKLSRYSGRDITSNISNLTGPGKGSISFKLNEADITDQIPAIIDIYDKLYAELGEKGAESFTAALQKIVENNDLAGVQKLIDSINFNNPIEAVDQLNNAMKYGSDGVKELAKDLLVLNNKTFNAASQLNFFTQSTAFEEMSKDVEKIFDKEHQLKATDIQEMAQSYSSLEKMMKQTGITAEAMARALTLAHKGELDLNNVSNGLANALSKIGQFGGQVSETLTRVGSWETTDDAETLWSTLSSGTKTVNDKVKKGRIGSQAVQDYYKNLFGDSYSKIIEANGGNVAKATKQMSYASRKFQGENSGQAWAQLLKGQNVFGQKAESTWTPGMGRTFETKDGKKFGLQKTGEGIKINGLENFSSISDLNKAIAEAYGVSEDTASAMTSDFSQFSGDFQQWVNKVQAMESLKGLSSDIFNTKDLEATLKLLGLSEEQIKKILEDKFDLNNEDSDFAKKLAESLGVSREELEKILDLIKKVNQSGKKVELKNPNGTVKDDKETTGTLLNAGIIRNLYDNDGYYTGTTIDVDEYRKAAFKDNIGKEKQNEYLQNLVNSGMLNQWTENGITIPITPDMSLEQIEKEINDKTGRDGSGIKTEIEVGLKDGGQLVKEIQDALAQGTYTIEVEATVTGLPTEGEGSNGSGIQGGGDKTGAIITSAAKGAYFGSYAGGIRSGPYSSPYRDSPGVSLTGEEGPEIVWNKEKRYSYIVGENGPEFANLQAGDQVFNNRQTKKILRNGIDILGSNAKGTFNSFDSGTANFGGGGSGNAQSGIKDDSDSGKKSKWKNSIDWFFNYIQRTTQALKTREKYEREYDLLLKMQNRSLSEVIKNYNNLRAALAEQQASQEEMRERAEYRLKQLEEQKKGGKKFGSYVWYEQDEAGTFRLKIDWDKVNSISSKDKGEELNDYITKLQEAVDHANEANEQLDDIKSQILELNERGKQEYFDLENRVLDALKSQMEEEIKDLEKQNEIISNFSNKIIENIQKQISEMRRIRDNMKTEDELSEKRLRLAYLEQDTSNGNLLEIKKLREELKDEEENYTDSLVDQKLDKMREELDKAAEQREQMIKIQQEQLEYDMETGQLWNQVHDLISSAFDEDGTFKSTSDLIELLKTPDGFEGLSELQKVNWLNELETAVITGFSWLKTGSNLQASVEKGELSEGRQISFTDSSGNTQTGIITSNGDVMLTDSNGNFTGKSVSGQSIKRDENGNWVAEGEGSAPIWDSKYHLATADEITFTNSEGEEVKGKKIRDGVYVDEEGYTHTNVHELEGTNGKYGTDEERYFDQDNAQIQGNDLLNGANEEGLLEIVDPKNKKKTIIVQMLDNGDAVQVSAKKDKKTGKLSNPKPYKDGNVYTKIYKKDGKYYAVDGPTSYKVSGLSNMELGKGSSDNIKRLQKTLAYLNYYRIGSDDDGDFGANTEKALKKFQADHGLEVNGKFDKNTKNKFKEVYKFKTGGLADFTGPAWLDGTKSRPEIVLNQKDSQNFLMLKDILSSFIRGTGSINSQTNGDNYYEIDIHVDSISSDYDVDKMAARIKKEIVQDSMYRNVNAIRRTR